MPITDKIQYVQVKEYPLTRVLREMQNKSKKSAVPLKSIPSEQLLFADDNRPILDVLVNVNVATWKQEGLFKRQRVMTKYNGIVDISVGEKMRFVQNMISKWYELSLPNPNGVRTDTGVGLARQMIIAERRAGVRKMFDRIKDPDFAARMEEFILMEKPVQAQYFTKKIGTRWPQFVIDFNEGLTDMMVVR
jgi:hypothetical protein